MQKNIKNKNLILARQQHWIQRAEQRINLLLDASMENEILKNIEIGKCIQLTKISFTKDDCKWFSRIFNKFCIVITNAYCNSIKTILQPESYFKKQKIFFEYIEKLNKIA